MVQAILLAAVLSGLCGLALLSVGRYLRLSIENQAALRQAVAGLPVLARLENRFEARQADLRARLSALEVEIGTTRQQRYKLRKAAQDARQAAQAPVRVIGPEGLGNRFIAWMINRQVQSALAQGKETAFLDPDWASPQLVEAWAPTLVDARRELQRHYPPPLGFSIISLKLDAPRAEDEAGDGAGDRAMAEQVSA